MSEVVAPPSESPRKKILKRLETLRLQRNSYLDHWRELAENFMPRRFRWLTSEVKSGRSGTKRNDKIINSVVIQSARTLASGMMAGITSPARTWFRLSTPDPELNARPAVRKYLWDIETVMRIIMAKSNFYNALSGAVYLDLGVFGTSCVFIEEDDEDVIRCYALPVGEYFLASSARGIIDTVYRETPFTIGQLVERFGLDSCSQSVKDAYTRGQIDDWRDVIHIVEPNRDLVLGKKDASGKKYVSRWMEKEGDDTTGFLKVSGYNEFPALCPRWTVTGIDAYGSSPGMDALGDAKALQQLERRGAEVMDKVVRPPMVGPVSLRNQRASLVPGDVTYVDGPNAKFEAAITVNSQAVKVNEDKLMRHEDRIKQIFFADLWMMMLNDDRQQPITAREVDERHEEKMLQLGPVLERLNDELLDPAVERVFSIAYRRGLIPPPPPELQGGMELKIEYVSIMASAQKMLGLAGVEKMVGFATSLAQLVPAARDKLNADKMMDEYNMMVGNQPEFILTDEEVAVHRQEQMKQAQAQQQGQAALAAAKGAKDLSGAQLGQNSMLDKIMSSLSPTAAGATNAPSMMPPGAQP